MSWYCWGPTDDDYLFLGNTFEMMRAISEWSSLVPERRAPQLLNLLDTAEQNMPWSHWRKVSRQAEELLNDPELKLS